MQRQFNFSTGGGINLKWPAKIATLLSATAITMACGFGARGADVNKELNPKADYKNILSTTPRSCDGFLTKTRDR